LVRAILDAFPGARIEAVHDSRADAYGLATETPTPLLDAGTGPLPDLDAPDLEFAPDDAVFVDDIVDIPSPPLE
jgi:hypothetical protein